MSYAFDFGPQASEAYVTVNPARPAEKVGRYGINCAEDIQTVIERANEAQAEWSKVPGIERSERLNAFLDAVVARVDQIAMSVTLEQGKILAEARMETLKGCAEGRFMVGEASRTGGAHMASGRPGYVNQIMNRPRGVIFCISPWNFPAMTPLRKICPAVAFGNAVILKPSQFTPAASFILEDIAKEFFPKYLIQNLIVSGATTSEIVAKGKIHGVSFTGSVGTGRMVYAAASQNLIPVQLELGGKNGAIVNDTDDLPGAVQQIFASAMQTGGQRCTAISRVLVNKPLANEVKNLLAEKAEAMVLGDGADSKSQMGPLCNLAHWHGVSLNTKRAIDEGAEALAGGQPPEGAGEGAGYFFRPTILGNVMPGSFADQVEIFGPVVSVIEYDRFDRAMDILNGTEFGLTSALFSNDSRLVQRFLRESQNGMMHVNHGTVPDNNMPFGGIKHSGVGAYSVGPTAKNFYTSEHSAYLV